MAASTASRNVHRMLSLLGLICICATFILWIYEEKNYERGGIDLDFMDSPAVYIVGAVIAGYFILNLYWQKLKAKTAFLIGFFIIALANTIMLVAFVIDFIKTETYKASNRYPGKLKGLFESDNPPPQWLMILNDWLPVMVIVLITTCFIILLVNRKKWAVASQ